MGKTFVYMVAGVLVLAVLAVTTAYAAPLRFETHMSGSCQVLIYGTKDADTLGDPTTDCTQTIVGLQGADILTGGLNHNTYVYTRTRDSRASNDDTIVNFDTSKDLLDFHQACVAASAVCHLTPDNMPDGTPGNVTYGISQVWQCIPDLGCGDFYDTTIWVDLDGDNNADMAVFMYGQLFPTAANFNF